MKREKKRRLERAGWRVSNTSTFLGLRAEERLLDLKLALAGGLRQLRDAPEARLLSRIGAVEIPLLVQRLFRVEVRDFVVRQHYCQFVRPTLSLTRAGCGAC